MRDNKNSANTRETHQKGGEQNTRGKRKKKTKKKKKKKKQKPTTNKQTNKQTHKPLQTIRTFKDTAKLSKKDKE
jgi:hypothetical protein